MTAVKDSFVVLLKGIWDRLSEEERAKLPEWQRAECEKRYGASSSSLSSSSTTRSTTSSGGTP